MPDTKCPRCGTELCSSCQALYQPMTREQFREYLRGSAERVAKLPSRRDGDIMPLVNELREIGGDGWEPEPHRCESCSDGCREILSRDSSGNVYLTPETEPRKTREEVKQLQLTPDQLANAIAHAKQNVAEQIKWQDKAEQSDGASLPRKTLEELIAEYWDFGHSAFATEWVDRQRFHQRLADLAGQIAGREE